MGWLLGRKMKILLLARSISIQDVQTIQLKDGGNLKLTPEKIDVLDLSIKEEAVLDAKRDAKMRNKYIA